MDSLKKAFEKIGARVEVVERHVPKRWQSNEGGFTLDIRTDKKGEKFDLRIDAHRKDALEVVVVDKQPKDRHLLLMVKDGRNKQKFLCGHDEMHWFAAPVSKNAADVRRAKESLKPDIVKEIQGRTKKRNKSGIKRQGEWFFIPKRKMKVPAQMIMKNEPIQREGGGKPHLVEEVYRVGGETVYVSGGLSDRGKVLNAHEYADLQKRNPQAAKFYRPAMADAKVFGRGKIRHPDHHTLVLDYWHEIVPNAENKFATRSLRFID
jgi:hypothetical protein